MHWIVINSFSFISYVVGCVLANFVSQTISTMDVNHQINDFAFAAHEKTHNTHIRGTTTLVVLMFWLLLSNLSIVFPMVFLGAIVA